MQLEEYFDFLAPDDIRIKGTRVGIESILYEYIHRGQAPEAIAKMYPAVTLEQVYATILYFLRNKDAISAYMTDWLEWGRRQREAQAKAPPPIVVRLAELRTQHNAQCDPERQAALTRLTQMSQEMGLYD